MRHLKNFILPLLFLLGAALAVFLWAVKCGPLNPETQLYVLMYHHFVREGEPYNTWILTDTRFREDLQWLADHGYTTILPSELASGAPLPEKPVMLTFDDGYRSNYEIAYPILQEFQAKAVISMVVQYTEDGSPSFLTWDMCREMARSGLVEIGSHTCGTHGDQGVRRLKGESRAEYEARVLPDLQASIDRIEANTGVRPRFFAYPNGITDRWCRDFVREHFDVTVTTANAPGNLFWGLYDLPRANVTMNGPISNFLPD